MDPHCHIYWGLGLIAIQKWARFHFNENPLPLEEAEILIKTKLWEYFTNTIVYIRGERRLVLKLCQGTSFSLTSGSLSEYQLEHTICQTIEVNIDIS